MTQSEVSSKAKVFISYSRQETEFVRKLCQALDENQLEALVLWGDVTIGTDEWQKNLENIRRCDDFIFVISPTSIVSDVCGQELQMALENNKRLVPVLYREEKGMIKSVNPRLLAINFTFMRTDEEFASKLPALVEILKTDLEYGKQHSRLQARAREWDQQGRNPSFLLRGEGLVNAEALLLQSSGKEPAPTDLQKAYLQAARRDAVQRQRIINAAYAVALISAIILTVFSFLQRYAADRNSKDAHSSAATADANAQAAATQQFWAEVNADLARENEQKAIDNEQARSTQQYIAEQNRLIAEEKEKEAVALKNMAQAENAAAQALTLQRQPDQLFTSSQLGVYAIEISYTSAADNLLRENLALMPVPVTRQWLAGIIYGMSFSPNGKMLLTCGADQTARIWDTATWKQLVILPHDSIIRTCSFVFDNRWVITGSDDGIARAWDVASGREVWHYTHSSGITALSVSANNQFVALGGEDGKGAILRQANGSLMLSIQHTQTIQFLMFNPDSNRLASASADGATAIWNIATGSRYSSPMHSRMVGKVLYSPNGRWLATASVDRTSKVGSTTTGETVHTFTLDDRGEDVAFSPDSSRLATASDDGSVRIWDVKSGRELVKMKHNDDVCCVVFSPNGKWVASSSKDKTVRIWNASSGREVGRIPLDDVGKQLAFTPDGNGVVATDQSGLLQIWDLSDKLVEVARIEAPQTVADISISPDNQWLASITDDYWVILWPLEEEIRLGGNASGRPILQLKGLGTDIDFSHDGHWLGVSSVNGLVYLIDTQSNNVKTFPHGAAVEEISFNKDDSLLASACSDGTSVLWDTKSGQTVYAFQHRGSVNTVQFDIKNNWLITASENKILFWDLTTWQNFASLTTNGTIVDVSSSSGGKFLATATDLGVIEIWDLKAVEQGQIPLFPLYKLVQDSLTEDITFAFNGQWLISGEHLGQARIWEIEAGQQLSQTRGQENKITSLENSLVETKRELARLLHLQSVKSLQVTSKGEYLITASGRLISVWNLTQMHLVPIGNLVHEICSRIPYGLSQAQWSFYFGTEPYQTICDLPPP